MFGLPKSTEFNTKIPKQKFYEHLEVSPALKRAFVEQIRAIYWRNKLAAATLNLPEGTSVTEVEVFEIKLASPELDEAVLRQIDAEIPYHMLFALSFNGQCQAWISFKEAAAGSRAFKISRYYHTGWMPEDELCLTVGGLNMDALYENFVLQIAGDALQQGPKESLKVSVERDEKRKQLQKQIAVLERKLRNEKQLNRQMKINGEVKQLRKELQICNQ